MNPAERRWDPAIVVSCMRLAIVAAAVTGAQVHGGSRLAAPAFDVTCALAVCYSATTIWLAVTHRASTTSRLWVAADFGFLSVLTYASGGAHSELRLGYLLIPATVAVLGRPRQAAGVLGTSLLVFSAVALLYVVTAGGAPDYALAHIGSMAATAGLVFPLAIILIRRAAEAERQTSGSRELLGQLMEDEDETRRVLAQELHDTHVQNLHVALHELRRQQGDGSDNALDLIEGLLEGTLDQLRQRISDLYPASLEYAGLEPALLELAASRGRQGDTEIGVFVEPGVPLALNQLVYSTAREFLANILKHAHATRASVSVSVRGDEVVVEVSDNGLGLPLDADPTRARAGHIGLPAIRDRLRAIGGELTVLSGPRPVGTTARANIPVQAGRSPRARLEGPPRLKGGSTPHGSNDPSLEPARP